MIELYHSEPNTFSLKPLVALHEKGIDFVGHYVDWTSLEQYGEHRGPGGPKLNLEAENNPEIEGPVLVHDGAVITESFFMMEYLEDVFPAVALKLRTPYADWQVQVWGRFNGERAAPAISTLGCHKYLAPALKEKRINGADQALERMPTEERRNAWREAIDDSYSEEILADSRRRAGLLVERIEKALDGGKSWLVQDHYTLADIDAFALANPLPKLLPEACNATASPRTMEWLERMRARPAVKQALAESRTGRPDEAFVPGPEHPRWG
jgi:glutathione S-transferase